MCACTLLCDVKCNALRVSRLYIWCNINVTEDATTDNNTIIKEQTCILLLITSHKVTRAPNYFMISHA